MGSFVDFFQNMNWDKLLLFLVQIVAVLFCLTVHEFSHGLAAYALGDPTAKAQRRLSFNPLRHLDPFGTLMMLVFGFGWAKPVMVDMRYFKHPKSGMAITALAGPLSNFVLAFLALIGANILAPVVEQAAWTAWLFNFFFVLASLSIGLGVFNLIPFPPLDGSKIVAAILPDRLYFTVMRYERFGMLALMAVLWLGFLNTPLFALRSGVMDLFLKGTEWAQMIGRLFT